MSSDCGDLLSLSEAMLYPKQVHLFSFELFLVDNDSPTLVSDMASKNICASNFWTNYRNYSNKRPGHLLNFRYFYLSTYLRWALIHFLIEFGEDRKDT